MTNIGLLPVAERIADAILDMPDPRKGRAEKRRRVVGAILPLIEKAVVEIGLDQATLAIAARKRELTQAAET